MKSGMAAILLLTPLLLLGMGLASGSAPFSAPAAAFAAAHGAVALVVPLNGSDPNGSSSTPSVSSIPPPSCPLAPVNSTFGSMNCFQILDLTEVFVILIGLTITFYVYKDADRAELPGDAAEIAVTADEEMEMRRKQLEEEEAREEMEEHDE